MEIMILSFILTAIITALSIRNFDKSLAIYIHKFDTTSTWREYTADIPDFLLIAVCIITVLAFIVYRTRRRRGIYNNETKFFYLIMYAVPAAYTVKSFLKYLFGRITTREWLIKPELDGFHWFQGGGGYAGFPSGHMVVFTTLTASLWRFYPRYRAVYVLFLLTLAVALVATNYHFLSDVVAGAYLGVLIEVCTCRILKADR